MPESFAPLILCVLASCFNSKLIQ